MITQPSFFYSESGSCGLSPGYEVTWSLLWLLVSGLIPPTPHPSPEKKDPSTTYETFVLPVSLQLRIIVSFRSRGPVICHPLSPEGGYVSPQVRGGGRVGWFVEDGPRFKKGRRLRWCEDRLNMNWLKAEESLNVTWIAQCINVDWQRRRNWHLNVEFKAAWFIQVFMLKVTAKQCCAKDHFHSNAGIRCVVFSCDWVCLFVCLTLSHSLLSFRMQLKCFAH